MDDHRPVQAADPDKKLTQAPFSTRDGVTTGELLIEPSPPFRSSRVVLDDGRAVGLTEPSENSVVHHRHAGPDRRPGGRWSLSVPSFLRSSWGGVGAWLGAMTVVGLASMMFSPTLADLARDPGASTAESSDGWAPGIGIGGDAGARSDHERGSRARTTGELSYETTAPGPASSVADRSSGPSGGLDLDLGHRSGDRVVDTAPTIAGPGTPSVGATPGAPTVDSTAPAGGVVTEPMMSTSSTTSANSFPNSELVTTAPATVADAGADGEQTDGGPLGSVPPGSTSVPEHVTLPPHATVPPSGSPTTAPSSPSVTVTPPTTRKPVPADTRPSPGRGQGRGRSADPGPGAGGSNGSNGRAVGRPQ